MTERGVCGCGGEGEALDVATVGEGVEMWFCRCLHRYFFLFTFGLLTLFVRDGDGDGVLCRGVGVTWSCAICGVDLSERRFGDRAEHIRLDSIPHCE